MFENISAEAYIVRPTAVSLAGFAEDPQNDLAICAASLSGEAAW